MAAHPFGFRRARMEIRAQRRRLRWATRSENEVVAWVDALPLDGNRDAASSAFAQCIIKDRPDEALVRIRTIGNVRQQQDALYAAWMHWWPNDRERAFRWLTTAKISSAERELLIHGPKRPGQ